MNIYIQTGDVLYHKINELPENLKKVEGNLIHKGQDHSHTIRGNFELFSDEKDLFIMAKETCFLDHEEHNTIELPEGIYKKGIVSEYDHFLEESREVID